MAAVASAVNSTTSSGSSDGSTSTGDVIRRKRRRRLTTSDAEDEDDDEDEEGDEGDADDDGEDEEEEEEEGDDDDEGSETDSVVFSDYSGEFFEADEACDALGEGYVFGAPRTAYENAVLRLAMQARGHVNVHFLRLMLLCGFFYDVILNALFAEENIVWQQP